MEINISTTPTLEFSSMSKDGSLKDDLLNSPTKKKKKFGFFSFNSNTHEKSLKKNKESD